MTPTWGGPGEHLEPVGCRAQGSASLGVCSRVPACSRGITQFSRQRRGSVNGHCDLSQRDFWIGRLRSIGLVNVACFLGNCVGSPCNSWSLRGPNEEGLSSGVPRAVWRAHFKLLYIFHELWRHAKAVGVRGRGQGLEPLPTFYGLSY